MKEYEIINVSWNYDDTANQNTTTGECDYVDEHYIVTLAGVDNPFDMITKRVEKFMFNGETFKVGRIIKIQ